MLGAAVVVFLSLLNTTIGFVTTPLRAIRGRCSSLCQTPQQQQGDYCVANSGKERTICVVGGGFGGLYTALRLSKTLDKSTSLYLIDPKERFVFLPLLYELAMQSASLPEVAPRYEDILSGTGIKFIQGNVRNVDLEHKLCEIALCDILSRGMAIPVCNLHYDQLVIAAGSQPRLDMIPGAREHSLPFYRTQDADELQRRLKQLKEESAKNNQLARVTVIGAGYSGIELATSVAQFLGRRLGAVTVIDRNDRVLPASSAHNREVAERSLRAHGVSVRHNTAVKEVTAQGLQLSDAGGEFFFESNLILFTAGMEQSQFIKSIPLSKDQYGRIAAHKTLQSLDREDVFVLGDCCGVAGESLPSTAQVAIQQANIVANNLNLDWAAKKNNVSAPLEEFRFKSLGEMLSLGDANAAITSLGGYVAMSGPIAALGRRLVYAARMPTPGQAARAFFSASVMSTGKMISRWFQNDEMRS